MSITQRCNYAGPLGQLIPTRSFAHYLLDCLRGMAGALAECLRRAS